jgi:hypothetical protein
MQLEHVGRRSGNQYRTPLQVFNADVDGKPGAAIRRRPDATARQDFRRYQPADHDQGGGGVTRYRRGAARRVFARLPFEQAVLLTKTD